MKRIGIIAVLVCGVGKLRTEAFELKQEYYNKAKWSVRLTEKEGCGDGGFQELSVARAHAFLIERIHQSDKKMHCVFVCSK